MSNIEASTLSPNYYWLTYQIQLASASKNGQKLYLQEEEKNNQTKFRQHRKKEYVRFKHKSEKDNLFLN